MEYDYIMKISLPGGSYDQESTCIVRDLDLIPGLGRSPGGEHGNLLQYSCLENPHGQRILVGYSPQHLKELNTTEQHISNTSSYCGFFLSFGGVSFLVDLSHFCQWLFRS